MARAGLGAPRRVNTCVLAVQPEAEGDVLTVAGSVDEGFVQGRLLDLYHQTRLIGVAVVIEASARAISRARVINSASRQPAREADIGVLRAAPGPPLPPLLAPIFRIEGDYCLVAAGEADGAYKGEKLLVSRTKPQTGTSLPVAQITLEKINDDFSGGFLRLLDTAGPPVQIWELAERQRPPWPRWKRAGIVTQIDAGTQILSADIEIDSALQPGDLLELQPDDDACALRSRTVADARPLHRRCSRGMGPGGRDQPRPGAHPRHAYHDVLARLALTRAVPTSMDDRPRLAVPRAAPRPVATRQGSTPATESGAALDTISTVVWHRRLACVLMWHRRLGGAPRARRPWHTHRRDAGATVLR